MRARNMQPKLSALSGPHRKSDFRFAEVLSMGRDSCNAIHLDDPSVSLNHCSINLVGERFLLTDLESHSGTFVNGIPVNQRVLAAGDQIAVGNSLFLFELEDAQPSAGNAIDFDEAPPAAGETQQLRSDELFCLNPESLAALSPSERVSRVLSAVLKISTAIGSLRDVESLQWQLLFLIFDLIPAERGAIVLVAGDGGEICPPAAWDRVDGPGRPVLVNRALTRRVMLEGVSVLRNESSDAASAGATGARAGNAAHSILCVPLTASARTSGVIYLDADRHAAAFTKDDLELLAAIAGVAAIAIENARQFERLGTENQQLRAEVNLQHDMVGQGPRMSEIYRFIERVAPSDSTVLIHGESGTGKELAARAIHKNSTRKKEAFVALNCAALTETLLESELFGHEKGAFTGAVGQKKGLLEVAEGGSVFLDEVGELSLTLQAKLLRVLQEREFMRVGGTRPIKLNIRFLAATNKDLQKAVREETFRADLFHRLNVISMTMPPLREHSEDIHLLAEHFASRYAQKCNRKIRGISPEARASLMRYAWPGNIRELENAMERAVVIGCSDFILAEDLPEALMETTSSSASASASDSGQDSSLANYHTAILNLKKQLIVDAFEQSGGSMVETAKLLGVHSNYLHRLVRNLDLRLALKKINRT